VADKKRKTDVIEQKYRLQHSLSSFE
jgi:hypothetical protein